MSLSSGIDQNNPDPDYRGKFYPDLIPFNAPAGQQNLGEVLKIGNQALSPSTGLPQDATDFATLGCVKIETGTVGMGNQPALIIGEPGDILQIKGGTALGSILVGNGADTEELVAGASGLFLKTNPSAPLGVEWAVGGGGGGGVASVSAGDNIAVSGTASNPIVAVRNPLNATLNLGTQNTTGTTGALTYDDAVANSKGVLGAISLILSDSTFATGDQTQTNKSGYSAIGSTDTTTLSKTGLSKTLGATDLSISSSTAPITITPLATTDLNQVISGAGKVHTIQSSTGGATQPAYQVENTNGNANAVHIDLYKNSASPAINDGIGALSFHAKNSAGTSIEYARIQADQRSIASPNEAGSISFSVKQGSAGLQEYLRINAVSGYNELYRDLDTRGQRITTSTAQLNLLNPTNNGATLISNTGGASTITLQANGVGSQINLTSNSTCSLTSNAGNVSLTASQAVVLSAQNSIVQVPQSGNTTTKLQTDLTNVRYYPTYLVDNNNSNSVSIPPPQIQGERLTLVNTGITPISSWADYGSSFGAGAYAVYYAGSTGQVWIARTDASVVQIYDAGMTSLLGTITFSGWAERAYCFYETGGYMYIGGSFQSVNGNATPQFGFTKVNINSPYTEDPIYDSGSSFYGVDCGGGGTGVYAIYDYSGYLYAGGLFTNFYPNTAPCNNLFYVSNYTSGGGGQTYTEANGGTNGKVNALYNANGYLWVGGDFTNVNYNIYGLNYQYLATWNGNWDYVGGNAFNGAVNNITSTNSYPYLIVGGQFSSPFQYICYVDYNSPNNYPTDTALGVSASINRGCIFYNGNLYVFTTTNGVYQSSAFQLWTNLGTPYGGSPSFVGYFNGSEKVAFDNYNYFQSRSNVSQSASFVLTSGNFKFNTLSYTTATLALVDLGWDFVGDLTSGAVWRQTTYNPWGSFS